MKSLLLLIALLSTLFSSDQLILVLADDFNSSTASLQRYAKFQTEYRAVGEPITVNIGRNGLGWGKGIMNLEHTPQEPQKREGDGKAPAGIFGLTHVFGYASSRNTSMPYIEATNDLICVDDITSPDYNLLVHVNSSKAVKSFEWMRRDDPQYEVGVTVAHNSDQSKGAGSCIFLHVEKGPNHPTAGCTSMKLTDLSAIVGWLDPSAKPLLIQIPRSYCEQIVGKFSGISCSTGGMRP